MFFLGLNKKTQLVSFVYVCIFSYGLPWWLSGKECNAGDTGSIPKSGRSLGEGNGNPLQYSCLGNPTDRGAWWAYDPWDHKKSWRRLSDQTTKQQFSVAETVKYSTSFLCWPSFFFFFFFLTALWRYNSCTTQYTHLNHPIHWF